MFAELERLPLGPKYQIPIDFAADPRADKLNLNTGIYRDAAGHCKVMACVKTAEARLLEREATKDYLDILGTTSFAERLCGLVLGADSPHLERSIGLQTPGGTAALRLAGDFYRERLGGRRIWIGEQCWGNHLKIFAAAGLEVLRHPYADLESWQLDVEALCAFFEREGQPGDAVLVQACCHNPTGLDPEPAEWSAIGRALARAELLPLIDIAFFGMGRGLAEDLAGISAICDEVDEAMIAISLSKAFNLYRERAGGLVIVGRERDGAERAISQLRTLIRPLYSTPPAHGAAVVSEILADDALRAGWQAELNAILARVRRMRRLLPERLAACGVAGDFSYMPRQTGIFTPLGLSAREVARLRAEHAIYLSPSGWVNVVAIPEPRLDDLCRAIATVRLSAPSPAPHSSTPHPSAADRPEE